MIVIAKLGHDDSSVVDAKRMVPFVQSPCRTQIDMHLMPCLNLRVLGEDIFDILHARFSVDVSTGPCSEAGPFPSRNLPGAAGTIGEFSHGLQCGLWLKTISPGQ